MTAPINLRMGGTEWGMLILLSILWGGSFFFLGIALREVPPFTLVLARLGLSSLLMLGFMAATRRVRPRRAGLWRALFLLALLNTALRSEEHTSELQSLMRISYAVFCLKKKKKTTR